MARPDDDHVCMPLCDPEGQVMAVVHGSPDMPSAARAALAALAEAAKRQFEIDDADGELSRQQEVSRERIRKRRRRLLGDR